MNMPLVWDKTANAYTKKAHPTSLSVYQSLTPLSTANMTLPEYESVSLLDMVLISTPDGKQEAYRVASITTDTDTKEQNVYLEHCACTLGDSVIPDEQTVQGKTKTVDIKGTISYVLSALLGYQTPVKWSVGTVAATTTIYAVIGGMTVLDAINDMMTQIPAYQAVFVGGENNWHVDIVLRPTTPVCEARLSRNIEGCEISTSSQGLCTRVMSSGLSGGHLDSENINEVGVFAENMMLNDNLDAGQKYAIASAYLAAHSVPAVSVTISGLELSHQTGLPLDQFDVGTVCRLTLPEMNVVVNEVIVDKRYADVLDDPECVTFTLANAAPDLSIAVAQVMKASGMGGGRANSTAAKEVKEEHKRYETKFEKTDQYFRLLATDSEWDELGNQNITAYSQIVQTSANIQSVVTQTGSVLNVFDPTVSYHVGDRVLHGGVAYKFIKDHEPGGWIGTGENGDVVEVQNMYSQIDQTAEGVSSIVGQTGIVTEVFDKNRIYTPGMKVLYQGIAYEFTGTHAIGEDWNPNIVKLADSLQSQIIQESGRISSEITRATGAESALTSQIQQEASRIGLVVEKKNGQDVVKRSAIIAAINEDSTSTVTISADKIDLDGYVTANDIFVDGGLSAQETIYAGNLHVYEDSTMSGDLTMSGTSSIYTSYVECETVSADTYYLGDGTTDLTDGIKEIHLTGPDANDMYTLSATTLGGQTVTIGNFSRAASQGVTTTLNGVWGGSTYTVTAAPQGETWTINFDPTTTSDATWATELGTGTLSQNNNKWLTFPLYIGSYNPSGSMTRSVTINKSINATPVFSEGQKDVTPTVNPAGWRWHEVSGDTVLDNTVTARNPYNIANDQIAVVSMPTLSVNVTKTQAVVSASDGTVSNVVAAATHTQYADGQSSVVPTFGSFTGTPSSTAQELQPGTYEFKVTTDGTTTTDEFYTVPSAPSPIVPKISRDGSWSSGSQRFFAGTTGSDDITVTIKSGSQTPTLIYSGTTVTGISFDVMENDGTSAGADTGADITATINRTSTALQLGTFDSTNSKFTVSKASGGSINIGSSNAIQIGVTPLDIPVEKGTATPTTPIWQGDSTHKYNINATGTFTVGGQTITQNTGSISGGFEPTDAIDYGKKLAKGIQSITVSQTSKSAYDAATTVPTDTVTGDSYYFVTATPVMGDPVTRKFHTPASGGGGSDRWARYVEDITLTASDKGESTWLKFATYNTGETETDQNHKTSINVDASAVWDAGYTKGAEDAGGGIPKVVKGAWNGNTCVFTPSVSEGTATASVTITPDYTEKLINDSSLTDSTQIRIKDGDDQISSFNLYLRTVNASSGSFVGLAASNSLVQLKYLAKVPIEGGGGGGEQYSVASIDPIALTRNDITTSTKYPVLHYDDPSHSTQNTVPLQIDASEVYAQGLADGSRLDIETMRIVPNPLTQNTTYTLYPSSGKNVMAGIQFTVDTPTGIDSAQIYNSSDTLPSVWMKNLGEGELSKKFGQIRVDAKDGTFGYFVVDATKVYQAGINAGTGYSVMGTKSYGTIRAGGSYTIFPDSGYDAMEAATFYVDMPRVQDSVSQTISAPGTTTIYPTGQYGAMKRAVVTVPGITVNTASDQPTGSSPVTSIKVGHNKMVTVKFGNTTMATLYFKAVT